MGGEVSERSIFAMYFTKLAKLKQKLLNHENYEFIAYKFICIEVVRLSYAWSYVRGNTSYDGNGTRNGHGQGNGNGKRNLQFVRTRYLLRLSVSYVRTYTLSSPSVYPYTSLTY